MSGLFEELDIASADDNPFAIPDNTYPCVVSDLTVKPNAKGNMGMTFEYKVTEGQYEGRKITEYQRLPHSSDAEPLGEAEKATARSYIKRRLASLGIPEERMNSVGKDDLIGIECYIATKQNGDFTNVRSISLVNTGPAPSAADYNPLA